MAAGTILWKDETMRVNEDRIRGARRERRG